jgi:hypothetical protein
VTTQLSLFSTKIADPAENPPQSPVKNTAMIAFMSRLPADVRVKVMAHDPAALSHAGERPAAVMKRQSFYYINAITQIFSPFVLLGLKYEKEAYALTDTPQVKDYRSARKAVAAVESVYARMKIESPNEYALEHRHQKYENAVLAILAADNACESITDTKGAFFEEYYFHPTVIEGEADFWRMINTKLISHIISTALKID